MTTEKLPDDFIANIDTCNEEIARLSKRLGQTSPEFVANIYDANAKVEALTAELAKRKTAPVAEVSVTPTTTTVVPPVAIKQPEKELYGLQRSMAANVAAQGGTPTTSPAPKKKLSGLQLAIAANVKAQKKS